MLRANYSGVRVTMHNIIEINIKQTQIEPAGDIALVPELRVAVCLLIRPIKVS